MSNPSKITGLVKILWVDDHISKLRTYVDALTSKGFSVSTAASTEAALEIINSGEPFQLIIVDIMMPPPDGIECLRRISSVRRNVTFAALSSYLYLERYRDELKALEFPIALIEKDMTNTHASDFEQRFLNPIIELALRGVSNTIQDQECAIESVRSSDVDPFSVPLDAFMSMSILEKDQLVLKARQKAAHTIDRAFEEGKIWVFLCGSDTQIRVSSSSPDKIMEDDKVMEFAAVQHRAPFQFWRPVESEDFWCENGTSQQLCDYPCVTLNIQGERMVTHFDTGSPMTFYSYEELLQIGAVMPTTNFGLCTRGKKTYWSIVLKLEALIESNGKAINIKVTGQAVRDWLDGPFRRYCPDTCPHEGKFLKDICKRRRGLVGRNLLTENKLAIVLDGRKRETRLG